MRLTIGNLKGGVAKTTTALFLATGLAHTGRTLLVDADPLSQSATDWAGLALGAGVEFPATVVTLVNADTLGRQIEALARDYDHVVVDTGGEDERLFAAALMVTDELVVPVAPSPGELRRLPATFTVASRIDAVSPITARVLLVKVRSGTRAASDARELLEQEGLPVMASAVSMWQHYSEAFGSVPDDLGEYADVLSELTGAAEVVA
jgi:ATPases involved in chromosome partitioning